MSADRPLGLRRRDAHFVAIVAAVALCNVATSAAYWFVLRRDLRTVADSAAADLAPVAALASNAVTRADALAAVLVRHSSEPDGIEETPVERPAPPRVLGVGQTKTHTGAPLLYYDVRDASGEVSRHYVRPGRRTPASKQNSSAVSFSVSGSVGAHRPEENVTEEDCPPIYENALDEASFEENE